jgi:pilus assembly protein CpaB
MSIRTLATLAVAMFFGLVAVLLVRSYLSSATAVPVMAGNAGTVVPVVVAARRIERGSLLEPALLKVIDFPQAAVPVESFHRIADLGGQRLMLRTALANEILLPTNVSGPGGKLNLSGTVASGMRAVSIRSNDVVGVGGFVLPGDRVDVVLTRLTGTSNDPNSTVAQVLAENVRVLGVDQSDNDEADKPVVAKAVTVEVTPEQAQSISLGQSIGTVSLTLRRVADDTPLARKMMSVSDLGPAHRAVSRPAAPLVRVVRGTAASQVPIGPAGARMIAGSSAP